MASDQRPPRAAPPRSPNTTNPNAYPAPSYHAQRPPFQQVTQRESQNTVQFQPHERGDRSAPVIHDPRYQQQYDPNTPPTYYNGPQSPQSPQSPSYPIQHRAELAYVEENVGGFVDSSNMRRKKSLVKPDRERIDPNHRQWYYRNHAAQMESEAAGRLGVMPSTTGNIPQTSLRRGKSLLARDEDVQESGLALFKRGATLRRKRNAAAPPVPHPSEDSSFSWLGSTPGPKNGWMVYCYVITLCFPPFLLNVCGIRSPEQQRAWREKIGLVFIILILMTGVGFLTFGFTQTVCGRPPERKRTGNVEKDFLIMHGYVYQLSKWKHPAVSGSFTGQTNPLFEDYKAGGMDASFLFQKVNGHCRDQITLASGSSILPTSDGGLGWYFPCNLFDQYGTTGPNQTGYDSPRMCHVKSTSRSQYANMSPSGQVYYTWEDVQHDNRNLAVFESSVLDLSLLNWLRSAQVKYPPMFDALRNKNGTFNGMDLTMQFYRSKQHALGRCLQDIVTVGFIDTKTIGCVASDVVLYVSLVFIIGVVAIKFAMAVIFGWFLSWKLGAYKNETYEERRRRAAEIEDWADNIHSAAPGRYRPTVANQKYGGNRKTQFFPTTSRFSKADMLSPKSASPIGRPTTTYGGSPLRNTSSPMSYGSKQFLSAGDAAGFRSSRSSTSLPLEARSDPNLSPCPFPLDHVIPQPPPDYEPNNYPLAHTICLVTAYSESVEGLRTTLDSLATSDYPNSHKVIMVIADGMVKGSGNSLSTPEIVLSMMKNLVVPVDQVEAHSYVAIADGHKRHNMAKVYAGFYEYDDNTVESTKQQKVPIVLVAKVGNPLEATDPKPGNRGKRDSQIVLMAFLQKVMFDERMTTFEYEFFNSIWRVTGISPDRYEIVLCVDADTKIFPDSLTRMVACMVHDEEVMGLCGETKIANKSETWVTMIQVFEYYISHHLTKAFESMFGGVTCLPGCFSMYRIKAPKGNSGFWVPILANPDIVEHYSENIVDTLHKKNLLLLGEDRYLTTLMLKTFPKRKMLFCPQAVCKTIVPDTFSVLLSQRRRWINSTIHNLAELLLVRDLCGTFCFSMQFVVFMELAGTLVLPAAISFTIYLIVLSAIPGKETPVIPLVLLGIILGLPGLLIVVTSRKVAYVGWMLVYLFSLPIWNFALPAYAFWHFDDFSWGQTRMVAGEAKGGAGHGDKEGEFDSSYIVMKRWAEFERDRRFKSGTHSRDSTYIDLASGNNNNNGYGSGSPKRPDSQRYSMVSTSETHASEFFRERPQPAFVQGSYESGDSGFLTAPTSRPPRSQAPDLTLPTPLSVGIPRTREKRNSSLSLTSRSNAHHDDDSYTNSTGPDTSSQRLVASHDYSPSSSEEPASTPTQSTPTQHLLASGEYSAKSSKSSEWAAREQRSNERFTPVSPPPHMATMGIPLGGPSQVLRQGTVSTGTYAEATPNPYRHSVAQSASASYDNNHGGYAPPSEQDAVDEEVQSPMLMSPQHAQQGLATPKRNTRGVSLVDNGPVVSQQSRRVPRPSDRKSTAPVQQQQPTSSTSPPVDFNNNGRPRSRPPGPPPGAAPPVPGGRFEYPQYR